VTNLDYSPIDGLIQHTFMNEELQSQTQRGSNILGQFVLFAHLGPPAPKRHSSQ
jgi:hypothetical protein